MPGTERLTGKTLYVLAKPHPDWVSSRFVFGNRPDGQVLGKVFFTSQEGQPLIFELNADAEYPYEAELVRYFSHVLKIIAIRSSVAGFQSVGFNPSFVAGLLDEAISNAGWNWQATEGVSS